MNGRLEIEVAEEFDKVDLEAWTEVVGAAAAPVHYTPAYLRAYQASPLSPFGAVRYLTVRESGRPVAVLPCYLQDRGDPYGALAGAGLPAGPGPALLAHNWYCYDTRVPMVPLPAERRDRVLDATLDALAGQRQAVGAPLAGLVNVAGPDPVLAAARRRGWRIAPIVARYQLPLDGLPSYESYLVTLGSRTRRTIRQYLRRAADAGVTTSTERPHPALLRTVCTLSRETAAKYGSADMYPEQAFVDFVMGLGEHARVVRVDHGDRTVAAAVVLLDAERLHMWVGGTSHATVASFSPNYLLWATEIRTAIESGRQCVEGGRSNRPMKERHGMRELTLYACVTGTCG
ncbi:MULTISPECIES: GNAT family N-acetyltransferase [Streptacidiphilus]|uniref:GNAT family N-acetyltransferase n=1 Tax=Streptacidiphilus cavernicola TaxID=3342716 RepID=A0ABV6URP0_9ACTN|nr:GNAT family N-acetyltransferase [Streptacidiphilus jeojiense]